MTDTTTGDTRVTEPDVETTEAQAETEGARGTEPRPAASTETPGSGAGSAAGASRAAATSAAAVSGATGGREAALFDEAAAKDLQSRWQAIQVGFVDEPRGAVEQADKLVDEVMKRLAESFARERGELERAWSGGSEASTEDLRQAIRRYRSFFNRLLGL
jgi:6-phosphogluconolactonase/glucosamine-6-phosphate isomerase/deaminase